MLISLMIVASVWSVKGFNLSPAANYVFNHPTLKTFIRPTRSSYFGFSVNLRTSGVIVGAPRAQSDLEYQRNVNETGAIYKCSFVNPSSCTPFRLDRQGNTDYEDWYNHHSEIRSELKEHQMLGATVDGLGTENGWFIACAPHLKGALEVVYLLNGICYLTEGVAEIDEPTNLHKIKPLRLKAKQQNRDKIYNYMFGEQGFSLHVTDDGDELLIGAPGVMFWRGTVLRYRQRSGLYLKGLRNVYLEYNYNRSLTHESVVPDPKYTNIPANSYFGYAVSSGRFLGTQKVLYVASAPQARNQHGEVIIFDYADNRTVQEAVIVRYRTFVGQQFGEYFGYALLTEDFNSDGLPDLAISAPMHSRAMEYDNGAVYVMLNVGEMNFDLQVKLMTTYELSGRFGTSLGKIGDLNKDGYGDIAIGAPFEEDGTVYIFLGSANGVQSRPSQRLVPSLSQLQKPSYQPHMFGHSLSRGVDIDGNGYADLAVGAPNGETVYVFRSYPVVRIEARINSTKRELPAQGGVFQIAVCWSIDFPAGVPFPIALQYTLDVDSQMGRASISNRRNPNTDYEPITIGNGTMCIEYNIVVKASPITLYKPMIIEIEFGLAPTATPPKNGSRFCEHCAILDPLDSTRVQERIPFKTGCRKELCVTDLKLTNLRWVDVPMLYIVGSTKTVTLEVDIENAGENAYLPQLNITTSSLLRLGSASNPSPECQQSEPVRDQISFLCSLNNGLPLKPLTRIRYFLTLDVTRVQAYVGFVDVHMQALTTSKEQWPKDNAAEAKLFVHEFSHIDIVSKTSPREASLDTNTKFLNITQLIKLHNNGPSPLNNTLLLVDVPISFTPTHLGDQKSCPIISLADVQVRSSFNDTPLEVNWFQPSSEKGLLKQTFGFYTKKQSEPLLPRRRTDEVDAPTNIDYSMRPSSMEYLEEEHPSRYDREENAQTRHKRSNLWLHPLQHNLSSIQLEELPPLRTVYFNCAQNTSNVDCLQLQVRLPPFPAINKPIFLELQYKLNLKELEACLQKQEDIFVVQLLSDLQKPLDEARETFRIARNTPYTVIYRDVSVSTPIWIYVTSSFGGLLLLAVITFTMHRMGFFERHMKREMQRMNRESDTSNCLADQQCTEEEITEI
ncbi:integrin alpha-PS3-like [Anopheles maculipalpis]|uniref:integrin alpha-PS3-like n=1 Tax=Anopheles maculipalpis TaxID=1496333 RepID=UPI0021599818|nr:integrin alpha-PS3-like [Anopheles maculipalpis]